MAVRTSEVPLALDVVARRRTRLRAPLQIWVPAGILVALFAWCFLAPVFGVPGPNDGSFSQTLQPPLSAGHLLGTDNLGNDILSRCLYGGQVSLAVGLGSVALGLVIGAPLGMIAGYRGRATDAVIMRILDMFLAFPSLVLALAVATYLGPNERDVIFAIAFFTVPAFARLARATTLRLREQGFILSSTLIGARQKRVLVRHVLPNVLPTLVTYGLLTVAVAMIIEAALDYLGLGVRPPEPSWGSMIAAGQTDLTSAPWTVFVPAAFLFVAVTCLNMIGDALRLRWAR